MLTKRKTVTLIFIVFFLWIFGFFIFIYKSDHIKSEEKAKIAVVFTGRKIRLEKALKLLREEKISELFISGVHKKTTPFIFKRYYDVQKKDNITLGYDAKNTEENALETIEWIKKKNLKTIMLITDSEHMLRCLLEMKKRTSIRIIPYPIFPSKRRLKPLLLEYNKCLPILVFNGTKTLSKMFLSFLNH
jgi:uncharacterized SAM-binding protein YcdF (DUF218 family)